MKQCSKCGIEKELTEFYKNRAQKDGLCNRCKICKKEYQKQYYQGNKEQIGERRKQYQSENKEKISEYSKQYQSENKEQIAEYHKQYYQGNKEQIGERRKQYSANNRLKYKADCSGCGKERTFRSEYQFNKDKGKLCLSCTLRLSPDGTIRPRSDKARHNEWARKVRKQNGNVCAYRDADLVPCSGYPLHAHHIFSRSKFPELSENVNNGIVLCAEHHAQVHELAGEHTVAALIRSKL